MSAPLLEGLAGGHKPGLPSLRSSRPTADDQSGPWRRFVEDWRPADVLGVHYVNAARGTKSEFFASRQKGRAVQGGGRRRRRCRRGRPSRWSRWSLPAGSPSLDRDRIAGIGRVPSVPLTPPRVSAPPTRIVLLRNQPSWVVGLSRKLIFAGQQPGNSRPDESRETPARPNAETPVK